MSERIEGKVEKIRLWKDEDGNRNITVFIDKELSVCFRNLKKGVYDVCKEQLKRKQEENNKYLTKTRKSGRRWKMGEKKDWLDDVIWGALKKQKKIVLFLCEDMEGGFGMKIDGKEVIRNLPWETLQFEIEIKEPKLESEWKRYE